MLSYRVQLCLIDHVRALERPPAGFGVSLGDVDRSVDGLDRVAVLAGGEWSHHVGEPRVVYPCINGTGVVLGNQPTV